MSLEVNLEANTSHGPWQVLGRLGRGGMGEVLLVERSAPRQRAALKLLPRVKSEEERRSYRREQMLLDRIEHPNIARLLDFGETEEGRPYLVLELVEGERIDDHCRRRGLGLEARLQLFIVVCRAVSAAHQQLVIHCDLKPSNVLVRSEDEMVKLLDFGLARQVADKMSTSTLVSSYSTWAYASPEQLAGRPLSTVSDVYSLGVLLFELLTDTRLFASLEPGFLNHVEARREPPRASDSLAQGISERWRRALKQELDYVINKALQPEPEGRYGSVGELAEDLEAFLAGSPVKARQTDRFYTLRCRLRRNLVPVAAAALLTAAAVVATTTLGFQARQLAAERDLALHHEKVAQETAEFFLGLLRKLPDSEIPGPWTIRTLASLAVLELDFQLLDVWRVRARVLDMLGEHYRFAGNLGQARLLREDALKIWEEKLGVDSKEAIHSLEGLAKCHLEAGAAETGCRLAREVASRASRLNDEGMQASAYNILAFCALSSGRLKEAEELVEKAKETALRRYGFGSLQHESQIVNLINILALLGRKPDEHTLLQLIESRNQRRPSRQDSVILEWRYRLATELLERQEFDAAEEVLKPVFETMQVRDKPFHWLRDLHVGEVELQLADIHRRRGHPETALRLARIASARLRRDLPPDNPRLRVARRIEAFALLEAGQFSEAREAFELLLAEIEATGDGGGLEEAEIRKALQGVAHSSSSPKGASQGPTLP